MGNAIYATSALALAGAVAAGPASAADMLSVGVGGYMEQWIGMADTDAKDKKNDGGFAQNSDSEIHFKGKMESDSGLTFSVKIELEGNSNDSHIDESQMTIGGSFGQIVLGSEDDAPSLMHYGHQDVGIGLNAGDTAAWLGGAASFGLNTTGWHGDRQMISYYTPRVSGAAFGASYIPDTGSEDKNMAPMNNDKSAWGVGANFQSDLGGASVALSVGHYQASQVGMSEMVFDGMMKGEEDDDPRQPANYTQAMYKADMGAQEKYSDALKMGDADIAAAASGAKTANDRMAMHQVDMMTKADDKTFSNVGLQVGFGAFGFNVAYATNDGGTYKHMRMNEVVRASTGTWTETVDGTTTTYYESQAAKTDGGGTHGIKNDPSNDKVMDVHMKDKSMDYDVVSAGVKYADGPLAVSLGYMASDYDNGDESNATMLSMAYTLAPGVASKTSIFSAEGTKGGSTVEGTGFVTGITIGF